MSARWGRCANLSRLKTSNTFCWTPEHALRHHRQFVCTPKHAPFANLATNPIVDGNTTSMPLSVSAGGAGHLASTCCWRSSQPARQNGNGSYGRGQPACSLLNVPEPHASATCPFMDSERSFVFRDFYSCLVAKLRRHFARC